MRDILAYPVGVLAGSCLLGAFWTATILLTAYRVTTACVSSVGHPTDSSQSG